jgi:hypothetical protein
MLATQSPDWRSWLSTLGNCHVLEISDRGAGLRLSSDPTATRTSTAVSSADTGLYWLTHKLLLPEKGGRRLGF